MSRETKSYPDSGWLNENLRKTTDSQPSWRGTLDISPELAAQIAKDGKMDIAGWDRPPGQYGKTISIKASVAYKKPGDTTPKPKPAEQQDDFNQDAGF